MVDIPQKVKEKDDCEFGKFSFGFDLKKKERQNVFLNPSSSRSENNIFRNV